MLLAIPQVHHSFCFEVETLYYYWFFKGLKKSNTFWLARILVETETS